nr:hypothetical protein [Nonlabens ulvanivorans]
MGDNTLTASYTLLSNDDSGLLKTTISVTNCEWIGYWKSEAVDDCDCYMEIWTVEEFCTTTTYQIPFTFLDSNPNSGGGGSSDGSSNSTWGYWYSCNGRNYWKRRRIPYSTIH